MKKADLMKTLILGAAFMAAASTSAMAQTTTTVDQGATTTTTTTVQKDHGGTAPGAVGGAVAGALVAGPIGAVVGGVAGATLGHAVAPPTEVKTYVTTQTVDPVQYSGKIVVGKSVDGDMVWREVPSYPKYHWAYLNGQRVVVDSHHTVVAVY
jgi:Protein of unknown function (DUF1236)